MLQATATDIVNAESHLPGTVFADGLEVGAFIFQALRLPGTAEERREFQVAEKPRQLGDVLLSQAGRHDFLASQGRAKGAHAGRVGRETRR